MDNKNVLQENSDLCSVYKKCSGCQLMNLEYSEQLSLKQAKMIKLFGKFCHVDEIIGMDDPKHYRNKATQVFKLTYPNKRIISGIYQSTTGGIVSCDHCLLEDEKSSAIIRAIRRLMPKYKLLPFDEYSGKGLLRHVLVRKGTVSGEYMVCFVTASAIFPKGKELAKELVSKYPEIKTVVQNVSTTPDKVMLGDTEKVLYGSGEITDTLLGLKFSISARSFYQVNHVQTEKLYSKAIEFANLGGDERVLDCYCGIGTIGLIASKHCGEVLGVESNASAVKDAKKNARLNGIKNVGFVCSDTGRLLSELCEQGERADVVMLDPARAGCDRKTLSSLLEMMPDRIVYISCNPETQERDVKELVKGGYKLKRVQPVDMFPFTSHVENICLLEKR